MTAATTQPNQPASASTSSAAGAPTPGSAKTVGSQLKASPAIRAAVNAIRDEVAAKSRTITGERPGDPSLKDAYDAIMKRAVEVRGRGLIYPYIGSGAGNGALVELADGSVKWDMISGIGVHFFGHSDPDLIEAAALASIDDTVKQGNLQTTMEPFELSETLLTEAKKGSRLRHAYIATGGAMANENALKVCLHKKHLDNLRSLAATPNATPEQLLAKTSTSPRVIAFKDCFMGRSLGMASIGDNHTGREGLPITLDVDYMPFWDASAAERMGPGGKKRFIDMAVWHLEQYIHRYPGAHVCFILEMVQGEGGFNVGDRDYFKAIIDVCKAHKIAVWDDEIQTFGRLPRMFAYEHFDLGEYVDVFCVGKMTQACVTMWTEEFNPRAGILSGTFTGEGVSFRVGKRVIEKLRDGNYYGDQGRFTKHHALFRQHAMALISRHPEWFPPVAALNGGGEKLVGGLGGMMRFTPYGGDKDKILKAAKAIFEEGAILFYCGHGPYHVRMLPPLPAMREEDWPRIFACIERGMAKAGA
jgi:4-aminobutyrate aminotransferase-like enzyme